LGQASLVKGHAFDTGILFFRATSALFFIFLLFLFFIVLFIYFIYLFV